jgi:hypothetical protein
MAAVEVFFDRRCFSFSGVTRSSRFILLLFDRKLADGLSVLEL